MLLRMFLSSYRSISGNNAKRTSSRVNLDKRSQASMQTSASGNVNLHYFKISFRNVEVEPYGTKHPLLLSGLRLCIHVNYSQTCIHVQHSQ